MQIDGKILPCVHVLLEVSGPKHPVLLLGRQAGIEVAAAEEDADSGHDAGCRISMTHADGWQLSTSQTCEHAPSISTPT